MRATILSRVRLRVLLLAGLALFPAGLALLLAAGVVPAVAQADGPNQAGLVVQLDEGQVISRCVSFEAEQIRGAEMLQQSGLEVVLNPASSMGVTVCQIEGAGCAFPAESCFCQCKGGGECAYWNYYYRDPGQEAWVYSAMGAAMRQVKPGSVEAWVWGQGNVPPPEELTFEAICPPATVMPGTDPTLQPEATAAAAAAGAAEPSKTSPTAAATEVPVAATQVALAASATVPPATAGATVPAVPADAGQAGRSYWPFGLMVLVLALVGVLVWRRRAG